MRKIIILLILFVSTMTVVAVTPLDSLFVEAVIKADKACCDNGLYININESYKSNLFKLLREKGETISSYKYSNQGDTIYIICDYGVEGGSSYNILTPKWQQTTSLESFQYINMWTSIHRSQTPEIEWIENWETDSLKKYGVFSRRVKDGIAYRYIVRYIIDNNTVKTDTVKYVPNIDVLYDCKKWRKQKYGY